MPTKKGDTLRNKNTSPEPRQKKGVGFIGALLLIALSCLLSDSCIDPNAHSSRIVLAVEKAGAGDLSSTTTPELQKWFVQQSPQFVSRIDQDCAPLRAVATANWAYRTAEGRVCVAVSQVAAFVSPQYQADQRAY